MKYIDKNLKVNSFIKNLYLEDEIGVSKVSELLDMKIIDARKLVKEWSFNEIDLQVLV